VRRVNRRPGAGGGVERASAIGPASKDTSDGGTKVGGIGSGVVNGKRRQLTRKRRARASAQHQGAKIFRCAGVNGLVATNTFRSSMNIRADVFAVSHAAWRYVTCWIVRRGIERGVGVGVLSA
jgi:hypothetical protein